MPKLELTPSQNRPMVGLLEAMSDIKQSIEMFNWH